MAKINANENSVVLELDWLEEMILRRINHYFQKEGGEPVNPFLPAPDLSNWSDAYASFVKEKNFNIEERLCIILSLVPLLRPQMLDCMNIRNCDTGRRFVEFGCREPSEGRSLVPTLETLLFILDETEMDARISHACFFTDHPFLSVHCLRTDFADSCGYSATTLTPSQELVDKVIYGRAFKPKYSSDFPAKRMDTNRKWEDLILDDNTRVQVDEIRLWVQYGSRVREEWGLQNILRLGYRALFYGPPGSGKTMTASLLGQVTGKDVYRIDLSSVVSKYIGETEKNLGKLFSMAEDKEWILFFDEADSLFGRRTGIKDSHDRYANQEVSYLLQRIEDYHGLVVLSTNQKANIDEAFARRFQSVIKFPMPDAAHRKAIWTSAFSNRTSFEDSISWDEIAAKYELTGGAIMNVVQYSSVMAMSRGETVILLKDILKGIHREYHKEGKMI